MRREVGNAAASSESNFLALPLKTLQQQEPLHQSVKLPPRTRDAKTRKSSLAPCNGFLPPTTSFLITDPPEQDVELPGIFTRLRLYQGRVFKKKIPSKIEVSLDKGCGLAFDRAGIHSKYAKITANW